MRVAFRVDASVEIGTGHVMRCLVLAEIFKKNGAEVLFICREFPGHIAGVIKQQGFAVKLLSPPEAREGISWRQDAMQTIQALSTQFRWDWIVIDHYGIDGRWERVFRDKFSRDKGNKIFVIDDLANRQHDCDLLLDQNLYNAMHQRYDGLLPEQCRLLLGPEYCMLRKEFFQARKKVEVNKKYNNVNRVFVFFGGADSSNETGKTLSAISLLEGNNIIFDIVVGNSNMKKQEIEALCSRMNNVNFYCQIENISVLMLKADLAIGAAGSASWERCFLGLPSIILITADNQKEVAKKISLERAVINLGESKHVSVEAILQSLQHVIAHPELLNDMAENSIRLMPENKLNSEITSLMTAE